MVAAGSVMEDGNMRAHATPANPAQVTDAMVEAARDICVRDVGVEAPSRDTIKDALTAAIGADGRAVAWMRKWAFDGTDVMAMPKKDRPAGWVLHEVTRHRCIPDDVPLYAHPAPSGQAVAPLDDDQIMEIIKEVAPWKHEPKLNDLLTYEKSPPLFPQATYDVPSYRAVNFVRAVEKRLSAIAHPVQPGWRDMESAPHETNVLLAWWDDFQERWHMEAGMASWGWRRNGVSNMSKHGQATHWMPLPAAPQPKGE